MLSPEAVSATLRSDTSEAPEAPEASEAPEADERTQRQPAAFVGHALPAGHLLRHFRIDALIGEGGCGIVYRAQDLRLLRTVAIKEYMPASLAMRGADLSVSVRSPRCEQTFAQGLRSFVVEAQTLAGLERTGDALVEVHDFWEGNGTAYMVMRCYDGPTLRSWRRQQAQAPDEASLCALLAPLLDVLERIHAGQPPCYHRDIAPDNILLLGPGRPLLLDFGAARRVIGDATQDLSVVFKPGYAPIEQYGESETLHQGPWTDVYALCAVLHFLVTGEAPLASVNRLGGDALQPLARRAAGRYSARFLAGIDAGLQLLPQDRPPDMAALRRLLLPAAGGGPAPDQHPDPTPRRRWLLGGAAAALGLTALGSLGWRLGRTPDGSPPSQPQPQPVEVLGTLSMPSPPFALTAALQDIVDHADAQHSVSLTLRQQRLAIGTDALHYRIESNRGGHAYVYLSSSDQTRLYLLFPDELDRDNRIRAQVPLELPRRGPPLVAIGPPGTDLLLAVVSPHPRDFAGAGLAAPVDSLAAFDLDAVKQAWAAQPGAGRRLLGTTDCQTGSVCDEAYGAALERIEES